MKKNSKRTSHGILKLTKRLTQPQAQRRLAKIKRRKNK